MKAILFAFLLLFSQSAIASEAKLTAITGGTLISPNLDRPIEHSVLLVDGSRIAKIGKIEDTTVRNDADIIRADGKWIIPGLVDGHVHFFQSGGLYTRPDIIDLRRYRPYGEETAWVKSNLQDTFARYIRSGVTSVLDLGGPLWSFEVRERARKTEFAPRVAVAGPLIATWRPKELDLEDPPIIKVESPEDGRAQVQRLAALKPDLIKIWFIVPPGKGPGRYSNLIRAIVDESHRHGLRVAVHATELETARVAVKLGADVLAHSVQDREVDREFVELLVENKIVYIPTLLVSLRYEEVFAQQMVFHPAETRIANPHVLSTLSDLRKLSPAGIPYGIRRQMKAGDRPRPNPISLKNLKILQQAGVIIAAGTDAGNIGTPHGPAIFPELELMKQAGLSTDEILASATLNGQKLLGREGDLGTIEEGKTADMLILNSDPIKDINNISDIHAVVKDGEYYALKEPGQ